MGFVLYRVAISYFLLSHTHLIPSTSKYHEINNDWDLMVYPGNTPHRQSIFPLAINRRAIYYIELLGNMFSKHFLNGVRNKAH